jgi:hypothetical protein
LIPEPPPASRATGHGRKAQSSWWWGRRGGTRKPPGNPYCSRRYSIDHRAAQPACVSAPPWPASATSDTSRSCHSSPFRASGCYAPERESRGGSNCDPVGFSSYRQSPSR